MPGSESAAHLKLKRLSLIWAQAKGYPVVGTEVSLPNLRFRLDAAAYRPGSVKLLQFDETRRRNRWVNHAALGLTVIFECKANRADLIRDCRISLQITEKIRILSEARVEIEQRLKIASPSLLNGDGLWPEYESAAFERCTDPVYRKTVRTLQTLKFQLHGQTKMENLLRWNAANLHYLVVEPGIAQTHEIPSGWGLLVRSGTRLEQVILPEFAPVPDQRTLSLLHRIASSGSKATNREMGIRYEQIEAERRGVSLDESPEGSESD
jgi:hypothetical protein